VAGGSLGLDFASEHDGADDPTPTSHTVVQLAAGGAVAAAGVVVGDTIVAVNGTVATGRSHDAVVAMFKAAAPGELTLALQPGASKTAWAPPSARNGIGAVRNVQVAKVAGRSLGISFVSDHDLPTDAAPQTHTIFQLAPEGAAAAAGAELGDTIVAVNGTVATGRSHDEVAAMFKAAAPGELTLSLQPGAGKTALAVAMTPPGARSSSGSVRTVTVTKASDERLGLSFVSEHDHPTDPAPQTHTIVVLVPGSACAAAGVQEGDVIIAINGTQVTGKSQAEVNALFRAGENRLVLTLQSATPQR
jgi:C-terminal processing protease CtpA/Prc